MLQTILLMQKYDDVVYGYEEIKNKLKKDLGSYVITQDFPIRIINDQTLNASMDPLGLMRINEGLIKRFSYYELLAICAHEVAHNQCDHILDRAWKQAKKQKSNRALANFGASLMVGAAAMASMNGASVGYDSKETITMVENADQYFEVFRGAADEATLRYRFKFSREEELEADIIAFRFMEYMGFGGQYYISALKKLQSVTGNYNVNAGKYDSHPGTEFRIQMLEAMKNGYCGK